MSVVYWALVVIVYVIGIAGSGLFYGWARDNQSIWSLEEKEVRFLLSLVWFLSIPTYFLCSIVVYFFKFLWSFYSVFD